MDKQSLVSFHGKIMPCSQTITDLDLFGLGINIDPGIGIDAAKVVSDCIHSSRVKEMGQFLLKTNTDVEEEDDGDVLQSYDRLGEDEVKKFQIKLARSLVVFMELIHLLIARNRDLLLDVIQERKKGEPGAQHAYTRSLGRGEFSVGTLNSDARSSRSFPARQGSIGAHDSTSSQDGRSREDSSGKSRHRKQGSFATSGGDDHASGRHGRHKSRGSFSTFMGDDHATSGSASVSEKDNKQRTDNAIAIQSELQRAFITLSKDLHPMIFGLMRRETPDWLKKCCQENYFSSYAYRKAKIRKCCCFFLFESAVLLLIFMPSLVRAAIGEELAFEDVNVTSVMADGGSGHGPSPSTVPPNSVDGAPMIPTISRPAVSRPPSSPGGSLGSGSAVSRGSDAARSVKSLRSLKSQNHERLASC